MSIVYSSRPTRFFGFVSKIPVLFTLLLLITSVACGQGISQITGAWTGTIEIPGSPLELDVEFSAAIEKGGTYSIPAQAIADYPIVSLAVARGSVSFELGGGIPGNPSFSLMIVNDNELSGTFTQSGTSLDASFRRKRETSAPAVGETSRDLRGEIQSYLDSIRTLWNVPGLSVAVINDGEEMTFVSGLRDVDRKEAVTEDTRFAIGSSTKAFAATLIGILVDEGLLDWNEPVAAYLNDFDLFDKEATSRLRVRDLLTHVSGLPRHDLLWYLGSRLTREEIYRRLKYLEPVGPSGQEWRYQNLMYMTAGLLAERVTGKSWEELIETKILAPLKMSSETSLDVEALANDPKRSHAYRLQSGEIEEIPYRSLGAIAPAGSINTSARGILPWLRLNLGLPTTSSTSIIDPSNLRIIQSPQVVMPAMSAHKGLDLSLYGMGWMISYYRGDRIVYHGGSIDGFQAQITLIPEEQTAVSVFTNRQSALPESLALDVIDILRHEDRYRHAARLFSRVEAMDASVRGEVEDSRVEGTHPSRALREFAGRYAHPAYDTIVVKENNGRLSFEYFDVSTTLMHTHYDVFEIDTADDVLGGTRLIFNGGIDGSVRSLSTSLEVMLDPIEFTRLADRRLSDPAFLSRYVGPYDLSGQPMMIRELNGALKLSIPGQQDYRLVPVGIDIESRASFAVDGLEEFKVRFSTEEGKIVATFLQPNGTFVATKKGWSP